jgi:hypothetical protein
MQEMRICFHKDPISVPAMCDDLREGGAIHWLSMGRAFHDAVALMEADGIGIVTSGTWVRDELCLDDPADSVAKAIERWNRKGRPVPHSESL